MAMSHGGDVRRHLVGRGVISAYWFPDGITSGFPLGKK